jgi:hypothetical protein
MEIYTLFSQLVFQRELPPFNKVGSVGPLPVPQPDVGMFDA